MSDDLQHQILVSRLAVALGADGEIDTESLAMWSVSFVLGSACYPSAIDALPLIIPPTMSPGNARQVVAGLVGRQTETANSAYLKIFGMDVPSYFAAEADLVNRVRSERRVVDATIHVMEPPRKTFSGRAYKAEKSGESRKIDWVGAAAFVIFVVLVPLFLIGLGRVLTLP